MLQDGALSPTTARLLSRHVTADNHEALLAAAAGKSKREVEKLLAGLFPQADVPAGVRAVRAARGISSPESVAGGLQAMTAPPPVELAIASPTGSMSHDADRGHKDDGAAPGSRVGLRPPVIAGTPVPRAVTRPISAQRYEIRFTARAETYEKLRRAQDLLGHAVPSGDLAQVFDRALTLLVADLERKKFAATERPRKGRDQSKESRHIPADVRRAVWTRDGGRCAFFAPNGKRCDARRFLELHHLKPFATGGKATVDNIQVRCRAHNRYEGEMFYGPLRHSASENPPVPERVTRTHQDSSRPDEDARSPGLGRALERSDAPRPAAVGRNP